MRVLFLVRSLHVGGTERQLVELVRGLDPARFQCTVATFYAGGEFEADLRACPHVVLRTLHKRGRWDVAGFVASLRRIAREVSPQVVCGHLGVVNELALLAGAFARAPVVWNIRSSYVDFARYDWLPRAAFRLGAWLSRAPALVVYNSRAGQRYYEAHGYRARRACVIPNGIDVRRYAPDPEGRVRLRRQWGIEDGARVIGLVGRLDPMKDHRTFLQAMAAVATARPDARFVCIGAGADAPLAQALEAEAHALGVASRLTWTGGCADMPAAYSALDVSVSSSIGEGFSNVIAEAMACGVPCVVTDVGDSALVVGDPARVVPARDPQRLAAAVVACLERPSDGAVLRARIVEQFSAERMVEATAATLASIVKHG